MTRSALFALAMLGCTAPAESLPVDQAGPVNLGLTITPTVVPAGGTVQFDVTGAPPNRTVYLGYSPNGSATDTICPSVLSGECLDLNPPVNLVLVVRADATGSVSRQLTLPGGVPDGTYTLQAAAPLAGGLPADISAPAAMEVLTCDTWYADVDGDGFGDDATGQASCTPIPGFVTQAGDCDDSNADASPVLPERCNGFDDDCDGDLDEAGNAYFLDFDADGYGDAGATISACAPTSVTIGGSTVDYIEDDTDCDDRAADVNPAAIEVCNLIDDDCSGAADEGFDTELTFADNDDDGTGVGPQSCADLLAGGVTTSGVHEIYRDGVPMSVMCDMTTDGGGWMLVFRHDSDDGYFAATADALSSGEPEGPLFSMLSQLEDHRDADGTFEFRMTWPDSVYPGANTWTQTSNPATEPIAGYAPISVDYTQQNWGGLEPSTDPNTLVDGSIGAGTYYAVGTTTPFVGGIAGPNGPANTVALWVRNDVSDNVPFLSCGVFSGFADNTIDCDDRDEATYPLAPEVCDDGVDQDCSGFDEVCNPRFSCLDILTADPAAVDGFYMLDRLSGGTFEAFCDMGNGGWTLAMRAIVANFDYQDPLWTNEELLNAGVYDFDTPGTKSKYEAFIEVPGSEIRTSYPDDFANDFAHTLAAPFGSLREMFETTHEEIWAPDVATAVADDERVHPYFNTLVPADNQWNNSLCWEHSNVGINQREYLSLDTLLPYGPFCDWNDWARFGQRANGCQRFAGACTGDHTAQGWGGYVSRYPIDQLLWVR